MFQSSNSKSWLTEWLSCYWLTGGRTGVQVPEGRNARHMVVIKTGAAEHSVYISMLPKGLRSFMKGCASHGAQCAMLTVYRGSTQSWDDMKQKCIFLPGCCIEQVYSFATRFDVSLLLYLSMTKCRDRRVRGHFMKSCKKWSIHMKESLYATSLCYACVPV